jgi:hypothetical protein
MTSLPNLPEELENSTELKPSKLKEGLSIKSKAVIRFITPSFGAGLASLFMAFNGMTTVAGAGLILPLMIGYPIGILLSITYFIVVASVKIKREHPLRKLLLVWMFSIGSSYTSFFSIYEQMSEKGSLQYQSVEKTVAAHNKLVNNVRVILDKNILQIEDKNPKISQINQLNFKLESQIKKRAELEEKNKNAAGDIASTLAGIRQQISTLESNINPGNYQLYQRLVKLKKDKQDSLTKNLSAKVFVDSNQNSSQLFSQDESLHKDIISILEKTILVDKKKLEKECPVPKYDDYIKTPIFLIPIEVASEGGRQSVFLLFALIIAVSMEIIPILLSGIHLNKKDNKILNESEKKTDKDGNITKLNNNHLISYDVKSSKTSINQLSKVVSLIITSSKESCSEIFKSLFQGVGTTDNDRYIFSQKVRKAMSSSGLNDPTSRQDFLQYFYLQIDHNDKKISLLDFIDLSDDKNLSYRIAASLLLDIMKDSRFGWLKRNGQLKYDVQPSKALSGDSNQKLLTTTDQILENGKIVANESKKIQVWQFTDETTYQDFISWWLDEQHRLEDFEESAEQIQSNLDILITYMKNSRPL